MLKYDANERIDWIDLYDHSLLKEDICANNDEMSKSMCTSIL